MLQFHAILLLAVMFTAS